MVDIQTLNRLPFKMGAPVALVEAAVLDIPTQLQARAVLVIPPLYLRPKEVMAGLRLHLGHWLRRAGAAVRRLLAQMLLAAPPVEMAAMEPHHLFPAHLLLMQAGAVALLFLPAHSGQVVQVAAEMPLMEQAQVEPLIREAVVAVEILVVAQAVPVL